MADELPPKPASTPVPDAAPVPPTPSPSNPAPILLTPSEVTPPAPRLIPDDPTYPDRSTGLVIFGVGQIILGLLAALMVPFALLGAFMSRLVPGGAGMRPAQVFGGILTYALLAAALLTLGIGSIQKKRWARALTLVCSWYGLVGGILATVLLTAVLPVTMRTALRAQQNSGAAQSPDFSTGIMAVLVTLIIVFCAFFLIVVPIAFVVFYSRKDVEQTCRHRDPVERWTDRTPLPVLAASVILAIGAAYLLVIGVTTPMFPFFGRYLTGLPGAAGMLALAALDAYLAVALFHLKPTAWWIAVVTLFIRLVSAFLTYGRADLMQAYSKMGMSDSQLQMMNANPIFHSHVILWWSLIWIVGLFGYLLWLKRYFKVPEPPLSSEPTAGGLLAQPPA